MSRNTKEFNDKADRFLREYNEEKIALERCLESKVNDDINFVCQKQRSDYLKGIALIFCEKEYNTAVKCQQKAEDRWASDCFKENVAFGQCTDSVLKKMYVYNLEHNDKNPRAN